MKRVLLLFCMVMLIFGLLCGCGGAPADPVDPTPDPDGPNPGTDDPGTSSEVLEHMWELIGSESKGAGLAFIGYVPEDSTEADLRAFLWESPVSYAYDFLVDASLVMTEGQEFYAIVPPCKAGTITICSSVLNDAGEYIDDFDNPLFEGEPGEPVLLLCNISEIYSNVIITATDGGGAVRFRPSVSLENGRIDHLNEIYDFTMYDLEPDEQDVENAMKLLSETDEVKASMAQGMNLMYTGDRQLIDGIPACCLRWASTTVTNSCGSSFTASVVTSSISTMPKAMNGIS